MRKINIISQ